jgi:hypothetical protein
MKQWLINIAKPSIVLREPVQNRRLVPGRVTNLDRPWILAESFHEPCQVFSILLRISERPGGTASTLHQAGWHR